MKCIMTFDLDDIKGLIATRCGISKVDVAIEAVSAREVDSSFALVQVSQPDSPDSRGCLYITVSLNHEPCLTPKGY